MNPPQVYTCSQSWTPLRPPSLYHPSESSQCTSPKHPVSCIEPGLAVHFIYDITHVSMPFSQIIPPSLSPTESKRLYTSVSLLLSRVQGYHCHLSKFHIYMLVYYIGGSEVKASACNAGDLGWSLGQEDPLEKEMAIHSSILTWRIPWMENPMEEPGGLQFMGSQRVGHDWVT